MANWVQRQFSKRKVDRAGDMLASGSLSGLAALVLNPMDRAIILNTVNNWRSSHGYPLHLAKKTLQDRAKRIDGDAVCAQRLKRLSSVTTKLRRNPNMKLSQMQDIGGCRAIVASCEQLMELIDAYEEAIRKNPPRKGKDKPITRSGWDLVERYDYVLNPKEDGYRSYHYVFRYLSKWEDYKIWNGLRIEIQLRTQYQHYWATAVEAVSIFTDQALKSGLGRVEWKRFFALMGSAIARREGCPAVPDTPDDPGTLVAEIKRLFEDLQVGIILQGITATVNLRNEYKAEAFLLVLDVEKKELTVKGYKASELELANQDYLIAEEQYVENPKMQVVLVSVDTLSVLEQAYPNYYLDTEEFLKLVRRVISEDPYADFGVSPYVSRDQKLPFQAPS